MLQWICLKLDLVTSRYFDDFIFVHPSFEQKQ